MTDPWLEQFNETTASALNGITSFGEVSTLNANHFVQHELALVNQAISARVESLQSLGHATTLQQVIDLQNELVGSLSGRMAALAKDQLELLMEMRKEYAAWYQTQSGNLPTIPAKRKA